LKHLKELLYMPHSGVSISIHTLNPERRKRLMPFGGSINSLISFLRKEIPLIPAGRRKKVSLAYLLIKGVNDSPEDLHELGQLARELGLGVTLLYYNRVADFMPLSESEYEEAFLRLRSMGVKVTLSTRFRKDRIGGCGTLMVNRKSDISIEEVKI
jgi:23S rRNA (adenine2503-C2)-methyltransferase